MFHQYLVSVIENSSTVCFVQCMIYLLMAFAKFKYLFPISDFAVEQKQLDTNFRSMAECFY